MSKQQTILEPDGFSGLVTSLKEFLKKQRREGKVVMDTPAIDRFLEQKQIEAGSRPRNERLG